LPAELECEQRLRDREMSPKTVLSGPDYRESVACLLLLLLNAFDMGTVTYAPTRIRNNPKYQATHMPKKLTMLKIAWRLVRDFPPRDRADSAATIVTTTITTITLVMADVACSMDFVAAGESMLRSKH